MTTASGPLSAVEPTSVAPVAARQRARHRAQGFGRLTIGAAVVTAGVMGIALFGALDSVDLGSLDPFGATVGWLVLFGFAVGGAAFALLLSVVALVRCRPRTTGVLALVSSLALPALAVWLALGAGVAVLKSHVATDLATDMGVVSRGLDVLEAWHVDVTPLRTLLPR